MNRNMGIEKLKVERGRGKETNQFQSGKRDARFEPMLCCGS